MSLKGISVGYAFFYRFKLNNTYITQCDTHFVGIFDEFVLAKKIKVVSVIIFDIN